LRNFLRNDRVRKMGDTLGIKNQGDRNLWDEPDPRVKWALDLLDNQGYETVPMMKRFTLPTALGAVGAGVGLMMNLSANKPMRAGLPRTFALFATGFGVAWWHAGYRARRQAETEAVARHYIMLHPDRFPEPEMLKYGDKRVLLPWKCMNDDYDDPIEERLKAEGKWDGKVPTN